MDKKETLEQVADATIQQPITLEVDIKPNSRVHRFLQDRGILPKKRALVLHPIVLGNLMRISKILVSIDMTIFDMQNLLESNYQAIMQHGEGMAKIVAIAVHNQKTEPPKSLEKFILYNFTAHEMLGVCGIVGKQMDISNFMSSIISMKGFNVLQSERKNAEKSIEVSPIERGSQIAPGMSSEVLQNTSVLV
jgi:hypothetical protein